jgi:NADP-dependent 3-hydroxy acid dehydrogenase YdfG
MAFPYSHVLVVGATSGIGRAMADRLVKEGVKITAVGRRKDRLDEFVRKHGESKAQAVQFDIRSQEKIPQFAEE